MGTAETPGDRTDDEFWHGVGIALLAAGALLRRRARRLAALDADEVLRRDTRPMVLYLRTFADDSLTIRTATYARRSFIDRLSPRRFVVGAAPEVITPGFGWELRAVDSQGLWSKTLLVLPPVPDAAMQTRWEQFTKTLTDTAMARHPIPTDPARTLALLGSPAAGWSTVTADQRTEWTYAEALAAATTMASSMLTVPNTGAGG